jgi:accessory gene regulator protein AgrB
MAEGNKEGSPFSVASPSKVFLDRLRVSKWKYAVAILVPNLVFLLMISVDICLGLLAVVLMVTLFLWLLRIDKFVHQLLIGVIALVVATLVLSGFAFSLFYEPTVGASSDDGTLIHGIVTPFKASIGTQVTFNLTVTAPMSVANANNIKVYVNIAEDLSSWSKNLTMKLKNPNSTSGTWIFINDTVVTSTVMSYVFIASVNGSWHQTEVMNGPISTDTFAVFVLLFSIWLPTMFTYGLMQFIVMILFLRFSSKSRQTREKMMQDYKKKKEEIGSAKQTSKGGSTKIAPAGSEETFVCSECGADVQASAKFCPQCGESFEEDDEDAGKKEGK